MRFHLLLGFLACMAGAAQAKPTWPDENSLQPQIQYNPKKYELSWPEVLVKLQNSPVLKGRLKTWRLKHGSHDQNSSPWRGKSAHRLVDQKLPTLPNPDDRHRKWHTGANGPTNSPVGEIWTYSKDKSFMEKIPEWYQPQPHYLDEPSDWHHSDDGRPPVPNGIVLDDYSSGHTVSDWRYRDAVRPKVPNGIGLDDYFSEHTSSAWHNRDAVRPKVPNGIRLVDYLSEHTPSAWHNRDEVRPKVANGIRLDDYFSGPTPSAWHNRDEVRPKIPNGIGLDDYLSEQTPSALHNRDGVRPKVSNGIGLDDIVSEHTPGVLHYTHDVTPKVPNSIGSGDSLPGNTPKNWHRPDEVLPTDANEPRNEPPLQYYS